MIKKISLQNFKQMREFTLNKVTPITIIGGRNNIGKTTLLEALFMFYDRANPEVTLRHSLWRGINWSNMSPEGLWKPIFHNYELQKEVVISIKDGKSDETLQIKHNTAFQGVIEMSPSFEHQMLSSLKNVPMESLEFVYLKNGKSIGNAHCIINNQELKIYVNNVKAIKKQITYISSLTKINHQEDARRFGIMDIEGRIPELLKGLQVIEPRLTSLSSISDGKQSLIYGDLDIGRKIPLSFMGEGTAKLLSIILAIATSKGGIVLIDEIENGLHYSMHYKLWPLLVDLSKQYNCQLFLTTHSYELLKSLEGAIPGDEDYLSYVRLARSDNNVVPHIYDMNMLFSAIEHDWEIR